MTLSSSGADAVQNQHRTGVAQMDTHDSYAGRCRCAINETGFSTPVLQCGPPRSLSWFITPITMVYGIYNYSYWGL